MNHDTILSLLEGSTGTLVFFAVAKWMPEWPITAKGIYDWVKHSIQEIASQRSGASMNQPPQPKE